MYRRLEVALRDLVLRPLPVGGAALLAALIAAPTLFAGFFVDDYLHLLTLRGEDTTATPYDLFQFAPGNAEEIAPDMNRGPFPWYTLPELKLHFFRPLASATMVLDHALFGDNAFAFHLHSLLWYVLLAVAVHLLLRRMMAAALAGLCTVLYILDDGHIIPVLWWSNRNAIVATAPAILGLVAHLRWREDGWRPGLPLSLAGYGLGLLGGETALGIFGYLIAYEWIRRHRDPWLGRVRSLTPAGILAVGYLIVYSLSNYGVHGSGIYLDPIGEWPSYLAATPVRLCDLLGAQFFALPAELTVLSNAARGPLLMLGVAGTVAVVAGGILLWRTCTPDERRLLLWAGVGSFIASLPVLATFPSGRLLLLPSIGGAVWIGLFIAKGTEAIRDARPRMVRGLGRVFLVLHVAAMPPYWVAVGTGIPVVMNLSEAAFREVDLDDTAVTDQYVTVLFAPDPYTGFYPMIIRQYLDFPEPRGWQTLSMAPFDHEVTRTGVRSFELRLLDGELLSTPFERLMRSHRYPLEAGDAVSLSECTIRVLEAGEWGPRHLRVTYKYPLDDPRYAFLAWQAGRLASFDWPPVGESRILRRSEGYFAWPNFKKRLPLL